MLANYFMPVSSAFCSFVFELILVLCAVRELCYVMQMCFTLYRA